MQTPEWFENAVNSPRESNELAVDGCSIHFDSWSHAESAPVLLFVHGNGAHSHWWDFIAPSFADDFNVAAMDMSGAGDSGHREQYGALQFAREIIEVCRNLKSERGASECIVVGHSFGGGMTRIAASQYGNELSGIVLVDSGISARRGRREPPRAPRPGIRYYDSLEQGKRRFRLRPPQPCDNDFIVDYIAGHSLRRSEAGYHFKLDQALFSRMAMDDATDLPDAATMVTELDIPVGFIYGEQSRFFPSDAVALLQELIEPELLIPIPNAHHHVFLDQPLRFIEALERILTRLNL